MGRITTIAMAIILLSSSSLSAEEDRATIQQRFAPKKKSIYGHVAATTHVRNDFYSMFGIGVDLGLYTSESIGFEVRGLLIDTSLAAPARDLKERTGLTPDARPQTAMTTAGIRWSLGYGKMLMWKKLVLHFDPQLFVHGGIAFAEKRILPTVLYGASLLNHFRWGLQFKIDLAGSFQMEKRARGWVPSFGFMPVFGIGWRWQWGRDGS